MIRLSVLQGCIYSGRFICHISNCFLFQNGMHVAEVSFSVRTILGIMQSLTFPALGRFLMFIIFNKIVRHIPAFWCCSILWCFIFKIYSLIVILGEILRNIPKTNIRVKPFSLLIKFICSFILPVRYVFSLFTLFITGVIFSHFLFKGLCIIKLNFVLEASGKTT